MFTSEVQFGHAGASANSERETAVAKNKVNTHVLVHVQHTIYMRAHTYTHTHTHTHTLYEDHVHCTVVLGITRSWCTCSRQL